MCARPPGHSCSPMTSLNDIATCLRWYSITVTLNVYPMKAEQRNRTKSKGQLLDTIDVGQATKRLISSTLKKNLRIESQYTDVKETIPTIYH